MIVQPAKVTNFDGVVARALVLSTED